MEQRTDLDGKYVFGASATIGYTSPKMRVLLKPTILTAATLGGQTLLTLKPQTMGMLQVQWTLSVYRGSRNILKLQTLGLLSRQELQ